MENEKSKWVSGSLHSHGFWSDYKNIHERVLSPFDLDYFIKICMKYGRHFQSALDVMACQSGKNSFSENRYNDLIKTAKLTKDYDLEINPIETRAYFKDGRKFYLPRVQEVIADNNLAHVLVLGLGRNDNIRGGNSVISTLEEIKNRGGYAFINHPFVCNSFEKEELLEFYEKGLILGTEFNGGVTIGKNLEPLAYKIMPNPPLKKDNEKVLDLEGKILIIANDDARCKSDVKNGAYTEYLIKDNPNNLFTQSLIDAMQNEIKDRLQGNYLKRHESYSPWWSMWYHGVCGVVSQKTFKEEGLPEL